MPKYVLRAVLGRMQFALHATRRTPHGASRLVQAMSAWLVKTRRASSRHSRDTRVYGHTTTAMHKLSIRLPIRPAAVCPKHLESWRYLTALRRITAARKNRLFSASGSNVSLSTKDSGTRWSRVTNLAARGGRRVRARG